MIKSLRDNHCLRYKTVQNYTKQNYKIQNYATLAIIDTTGGYST